MMNAPIKLYSTKAISTTEGITKAPIATPDVAKPTAMPRFLLKYKPTMTTPGPYANAFPIPEIDVILFFTNSLICTRNIYSIV